jgi:hypothetical protein
MNIKRLWITKGLNSYALIKSDARKVEKVGKGTLFEEFDGP